MKSSIDKAKRARSRSDDRLLWAEEAVRAMADNITEYAVVLLDDESRILSWNVGAQRMLGHSAEEIVGQDFFQSFFPADNTAREKHKRDLEEAKRTGHREDEFWLTRKNGAVLLAGITITAIHDKTGIPRGFTCLMHDLTERRQIEAAMKNSTEEGAKYNAALAKVLQAHTARFREADELFRQLTINIPHAIWIREADGKTLRYINPAWSKMTGLHVSAGDPEDRLYDAYHPDDLPLVMRESRKFPNGGMDFDCRIVVPEKAVRWVRIRTFSVENAEGCVVRVAGIMEDITARRSEEKRLERLKDDFVATVSHELRTPLTSIAGSLGLLANTGEQLAPQAARLVQIALASSERLVRLINGILDIEKIESGNLPFDMRRIRLYPLVEQTIESLRGFAAAYSVQISLDPECQDCEVRADPDRLAQVVTNLLANAIKFSPSDREVVVTIRKATDVIRVSVRDHGPGIPDAFKPRMFEKFAQADNTDARKKGGTGLGLSIAREIINRLGGEIGFDDAPGGGTTFYFELPDWATLAKAEQALSLVESGTERDAA